MSANYCDCDCFYYYCCVGAASHILAFVFVRVGAQCGLFPYLHNDVLFVCSASIQIDAEKIEMLLNTYLNHNHYTYYNTTA